MKTKRITSIILAIMLIFTSFSIVVSADPTPTAVIKVITCDIDETGHGEVYGYVENNTSNNSLNNQITFLLSTIENLSNIGSGVDTNNIIAYINQETLGNNDSFLFEFQIADKFFNKQLYLKMGHVEAETYNETIAIPEDGAPFRLHNISNGSVIYGLDAYTLDSTNLTATTVADSIIYGGNKIYYKIGNRWYDLLNENATDNSYLVEQNAENIETMEQLNLRYYYKFNYRFDFIN